MERVKEIHKHYFITDNGDEYPIFDDEISLEKMNEFIIRSKEIINDIRKNDE